MDFSGKVAVITGAARGIGKASALKLAEYGANIVAIDLKEDLINQTAKEVQELGREAIAIKVDITDYEQVESAINQTVERFGKVDILVNAAGVDVASTIDNLTEELWDLMMNVNAKGVFFCCKAAIKHMMINKSGKIVNISSQAGKLGEVGQGAYCCSKAAVGMFTQVLALEMAEYNVNVNAICPGLVSTEMLEGAIVGIANERGIDVEEFRQTWVDKIPMKRMAKPGEIGDLVAFLSSDKSSYMTGISYTIAGGLTVI